MVKFHIDGYPDPTEADINAPDFNAIWEAIKGWDIARRGDGMRAGATGNDVMRILLALRALPGAARIGGEHGRKLWDLLDRIDTLSDALKPQDLDGYKRFYEKTLEIAKLRHAILASDGYDLFVNNGAGGAVELGQKE